MDIFHFLKKHVQQEGKAILLLVVHSKGSSPGRQGFKMGVAMNNEISGSIGGGIMEYNLVEEAKIHLKEKTFIPFLKKQIHRGHVRDGSGMICSGEQVVLFKMIDSSHLQTLDQLINHPDGILKITPNTFAFTADETQGLQYKFLINSKQVWTYTEKINKKNKLYIIGAGHVGLATSEIFSKLHFEITLIDDRKDLNTLLSNRYTDHVIIRNYKDIAATITEGENTFIAIMTNGYATDKIALEKVIHKKVKYIGVLGSKAKLANLFKSLQKSGISSQQLENLHAPIGLFIHSQTPYEIAISIAAQIIAIKNKTT